MLITFTLSTLKKAVSAHRKHFKNFINILIHKVINTCENLFVNPVSKLSGKSYQHSPLFSVDNLKKTVDNCPFSCE